MHMHVNHNAYLFLSVNNNNNFNNHLSLVNNKMKYDENKLFIYLYFPFNEFNVLYIVGC